MMNTEITINHEGFSYTGVITNYIINTVSFLDSRTKQTIEIEMEQVALKHILQMMIDKIEMERKYGHLSCYDYPIEYIQMENLNDIICCCLMKYNESIYDNRYKHLYENLKDIAIDVINGNINFKKLTFCYMPIDEWVEVYVTRDMSKEAKQVFESMYYYMPTDLRNGWLEGNHLCNYTNLYTDTMMNYMLVAHEM
ncbi:hypothetical protein [Bacillus cereus]|uniref:hypothetical protein n=1 Tax=Bacillus cereus TaxID=1396 RepID=UPI002D799D00|nr:hypothetical protein [Bacillus cereus]